MNALKQQVCVSVVCVCVAVITMSDTEVTSRAVGRSEPDSVEDVFDHTYEEKAGPKPPMSIVWRNVILMTLLHTGALYGIFLIPSAQPLTLLWGKYQTVHVVITHN